VNPVAQKLIGRSYSDVVGQPIESAWPEWPRISKLLDDKTVGTKEVSSGTGDKKRYYEVESSRLPGFTSDEINLLIILRDVTKRKILDERLRLYSEQLKEYAEHLEDLVVERTKELREAERMAAIGETAAMVGHDLRNPLQAIVGATYVLKRNLRPTVDEQTKKMIEIIEGSVQHSNKIVSDLLDYSREPRLELKEANINQLVREAVASAKIPENVRVKLTLGELAIKLDSGMIRRAFLNIISNAIDAMPNGGELAIEGHESNGSVELSFTDTGVGFSDEAMAKLWKPLNTTKAQGSGLGLAICKRMVDAHNGTISVRTAAGKGTTLTITLPITPKE
jgi:two-component system sensor histidine kinase HydH